MPRRSNSELGSAFGQLQQQARGLLGTLRKEIRAKEAELERLKKDESRLSMVTGKVATEAGGRAGRAAGTGGGRINWREVLEQLPKQFKASDIREVRGLGGKRPSEIFAAVTRWIDAGSVKRRARGLYERAT
ncbi:MAG TPA: hypothetical protein VFE56_05925 [Candidatus Binataceae bacterium]|jgi:hypothetical protein|nr:hypothetical protein [Candidatus Binataceae bacterium]